MLQYSEWHDRLAAAGAAVRKNRGARFARVEPEVRVELDALLHLSRQAALDSALAGARAPEAVVLQHKAVLERAAGRRLHEAACYERSAKLWLAIEQERFLACTATAGEALYFCVIDTLMACAAFVAHAAATTDPQLLVPIPGVPMSSVMHRQRHPAPPAQGAGGGGGDGAGREKAKSIFGGLAGKLREKKRTAFSGVFASQQQQQAPGAAAEGGAPGASELGSAAPAFDPAELELLTRPQRCRHSPKVAALLTTLAEVLRRFCCSEVAADMYELAASFLATPHAVAAAKKKARAGDGPFDYSASRYRDPSASAGFEGPFTSLRETSPQTAAATAAQRGAAAAPMLQPLRPAAVLPAHRHGYVMSLVNAAVCAAALTQYERADRVAAELLAFSIPPPRGAAAELGGGDEASPVSNASITPFNAPVAAPAGPACFWSHLGGSLAAAEAAVAAAVLRVVVAMLDQRPEREVLAFLDGLEHHMLRPLGAMHRHAAPVDAARYTTPSGEAVMIDDVTDVGFGRLGTAASRRLERQLVVLVEGLRLMHTAGSGYCSGAPLRSWGVAPAAGGSGSDDDAFGTASADGGDAPAAKPAGEAPAAKQAEEAEEAPLFDGAVPLRSAPQKWQLLLEAAIVDVVAALPAAALGAIASEGVNAGLPLLVARVHERFTFDALPRYLTKDVPKPEKSDSPSPRRL
jgi:hypothetical protein